MALFPLSSIKRRTFFPVPAWGGVALAPLGDQLPLCCGSRRVGGWIVTFVDFRHPRVILELRGGKIREFVFSTRNPEEVCCLITERLGSVSPQDSPKTRGTAK